MASLNFKSFPPFINPSNFPPCDLTVSNYRNVIWPGSKENAVCMMFEAVYSCNIIHHAMAGSHKICALTIMPSATAFDSFHQFLWKKYAASDLYGLFDYGCLLTFTSRCEGLVGHLLLLIHIVSDVLQLVPLSLSFLLSVINATWNSLDPWQLHLLLLIGMSKTSLLLSIMIKIACDSTPLFYF